MYVLHIGIVHGAAKLTMYLSVNGRSIWTTPCLQHVLELDLCDTCHECGNQKMLVIVWESSMELNKSRIVTPPNIFQHLHELSMHVYTSNP